MADAKPKKIGNWEELRGLLVLDLKAPEKAVLLALRIRQGENADCWPTQPTLAVETGFKERAVRKAIRKLESLGLVSSRQNPDKAGRFNRYVVQTGTRCRSKPAPDAGSTGTKDRFNRHQMPDQPAPDAARIKEEEKKEESAGGRFGLHDGQRPPLEEPERLRRPVRIGERIPGLDLFAGKGDQP